MHVKRIITKGRDDAGRALIMMHGRGATAEDILTLSDHMDVQDFLLIAPQATNNTWYPYSFMMPPQQNEPWLSSALKLVGELVDELLQKGIPSTNIYFTRSQAGNLVH